MMKPLLSSVFLLLTLAFSALAQDTPIQAPPETNIVVPETNANGVTPPPAIVASVPPATTEPAAPQTPIEKEISEQLAYLRPSVNIDTMPSLFFSIWEHDLVRDARRGLNTRGNETDDGVDIAGPRDITLGGIIFTSKKDWTIWLNNVRVSPTRIPTEVMDLKVFRDYIELEWFDASTNQIFPIRLRPHQRFNLDTRIFLPG
jgi:hypothetical protein